MADERPDPTRFGTGLPDPTGSTGVPGAPNSGFNSSNSIDWSKLPGDVLKFFGDHWGDIAKVLGGAALAYTSFQSYAEANKNQANSDALMKEGIDMAKDDYASRGQYRDAAQQHLLNPTRPSLGGLFADSGNPYKNRVPVVGGPAGAPPTAPPPSTGGPDGGRPGNPVTGRPSPTAPPPGTPGNRGALPRFGGAQPPPVNEPSYVPPIPVVGGPVPTQPGGGEPVRGVPRPFKPPVVGRY